MTNFYALLLTAAAAEAATITIGGLFPTSVASFADSALDWQQGAQPVVILQRTFLD